jgi:succinyl-diaminopimelate desuccinylase
LVERERQALLASVDSGSIVKLTQDLVAIASPNPPGEEKQVAAYLASLLEEMGLETELQEVAPNRPNVLGIWDTGKPGPTVLLNGHTDVVPTGDGWSVDPHGGRISQGRLYGRGATDMKGGIASMIGALAAIQKCGVECSGRVIIAAVVGEETDQLGTRALVEAGIKADCAIIPEPTELRPVIAHQGTLQYRISTVGKAAHSSMPHMGVNAIYDMCRVVAGLRQVAESLESRKHALLGHPNLSVGTIEGGLDTCIVPDRCTITVDRRINPDEEMELVDQEIEDMVSRLCAGNPQMQVDVSRIVTAEAMQMSPDENVALSVRRAAEVITGRDPGFHGLPGTCDANYLVNEAGIPTVIFGPGIGAAAHRPDEYVEIKSLVRASQILAVAVFDLLHEG